MEQAGDDRPSMTEPGARSAMEVDDAHAFYFRGSDGHLNLAARSIETFMDIAKDVEEDVWLYHLERGDCARWFREVMGDERLATEADRLAHELCSASESRKLLQGARSD